MKLLVVLSLLVAFTAAAPAEEFSLEMLYAFDFEALLKNEEQRKVAFDCILEKADCGNIKPLRDAVMKTIANKCAGCNAEHKAKYEREMKIFQDQYKSVYDEVMKKIAAKA